MDLEEFLNNLHFDIDKVRPVDKDVDWGDAPLPFKLYQDLPAIDLSLAVSLDFDVQRDRSSVSLEGVTNLLWYSFGLTKLCHIKLPVEEAGEQSVFMQTLRRYVPSGGALYPSELYIYLKLEEMSTGIYHYDVAHHRLVLLREGNFDSYLQRALGHRHPVSSCFGVLFVSTLFWKNFYKYHDFAYRLQGLDAGELMGQLLEVGKQLGYESCVYYQFLDGAINYLLGLNDDEESVYGVIPVWVAEDPLMNIRDGKGIPTRIESTDSLCKEYPPIHPRHYVKSKRITPYPILIQMNQSSMLESTACFTQNCKSATERNKATVSLPEEAILLPKVSLPEFNFALACRQRFSPGLDFVPGRLPLNTFAALLHETASCAWDTDLNWDNNGQQLEVACCVHGMDGLSDGAYLYDAESHALRLRRPGDHRLALQQGMSMPSVNLFDVPLCLHIVGPRDFFQQNLGYRGYRILQMETGILLQRILLLVSGVGMAGHPLLGYDERVSDDIYDFDQGKTCLVQIPVGFYQKTSRFEGSLMV